nr:RNA-directed DNA polymerase, eukaryota [Tanacetum cinerariifolium]
GSLLHEEEEDDSYFHRKRLCTKISIGDNIFESFKIIVKEDVNDHALSEFSKEDSHSEADIIPEIVFEEGEVKSSDIKEKSNEETKMEHVSLFDIKSCWGNLIFDFVGSPSVGNSRGIFCVWDTNMFQKENVTVSDYFIAII